MRTRAGIQIVLEQDLEHNLARSTSTGHESWWVRVRRDGLSPGGLAPVRAGGDHTRTARQERLAARGKTVQLAEQAYHFQGGSGTFGSLIAYVTARPVDRLFERIAGEQSEQDG